MNDHDAMLAALDETTNQRDSAVVLLMAASTILRSLTPKHRDGPSIEEWHRRVGTLVVSIDRMEARRKMEGTLR